MANDSLQKKRDSRRWVERVESLLCRFLGITDTDSLL